MAVNFLKQRWRIIVIVISCAVVLNLLPFLFINVYLPWRLSQSLKSAVLKASDNLYHIDFSKAELHIFHGNAVLYDITLTPDTAIYHQMQRLGTAPVDLYDLKVKQLVITGAHPFKLYFHKQLDIGQITLNEPQVQVSRYGSAKPDDAVKKTSSTLYQKLSKSLKFIHINGINLNAIHCVYKDFSGIMPEVLVLKKMDLKATDLLIDSATQTDKSRSLFCRDVVTDLDHFRWVTADGLYKFKVKSVHLSTQTARLVITGVEMQPISSRAFFAKSKKKLERYTLHLDSIALTNFDFQSFRKYRALNVTKMTITKGDFEIYTNPKGLPKKNDRVVTYPNWVLRKMKTSLNVDTLDLRHIKFIYKMYNKKSMETGALLFSNTSARFLNITNKKGAIRRNKNSSVKLTTYVMGKGKLDLAFIFNLSGETYNYSYTGHLGPADLRAGNTVLMPLGLANVISGTEKSLDFNIHSTRKTSIGKVTFLYNNLKIALFRHDQQKGYSKRTLISLLANLVVIKRNNPDDGNTIQRTADVVYTRPAHVAFFESLWLTVLSGVKPCAGLGKAQKEVKTAAITEKEQRTEEKPEEKAIKN